MAFSSKSKHEHRKGGENSNRQELNLENLESRIMLDGSSVWGIADEFYGYEDTGGSDQVLQTEEHLSYSPEVAGNYNEVLPAKAPSVLYLDFDGGTVKSRSGDFWLGQSKIEVDGFDLSAFGWSGREQEAQSYILNYVQEDYAAYNIVITDQEPVSGEYTTIYVGGDNSWFRAGSNVIGVATYDVGNRDESNYGFAFVSELNTYYSASGGDLSTFCEYVSNLISHEAAHTYGANHIDDPDYLMNPYLAIRPVMTGFGGDSSQDTQQLLERNIGTASVGGDDYEDQVGRGYRLDESTTISGTIEHRQDRDAFELVAAHDGVVTVDLSTSEFGNLDSELSVYRSDTGALVAQNDNYEGQLDSWLSFNAESGTGYTVIVGSSGQASSGTYQLAVDMPAAPPHITVTDTSGNPDDQVIQLDAVTVGSATSASITLGNSGYEDLVISQMTVTGGFTLDRTNGPADSDDITLTPGETLTVTVTLDPDSSGVYTGSVTIVSNDPDQASVQVAVSGQGLDPQADLVFSSAVDNRVEFGSVYRGQGLSRVIQIQNAGTLDLELGQISTDGGFEVVSVSGDRIAPGESGSVIVTFNGTERGAETGHLTVMSNDPDEPQAVLDLQVQVVAGELTVVEDYGTANDNRVEFGTVYLGETVTRTVELVNTGDAGLTLDDLQIDGGFSVVNGYSLTGYQLQPGESVELVLSFSPDVEGYFQENVVLTTHDSQVQSIIDVQAEVADNPLEIAAGQMNLAGELDFGDVRTGDDLVMDAWTIVNHGNQAARINLTLNGAEGFYLVGDATLMIQPGQSVVVQAGIHTDRALAIDGSLVLAADDYHQTEASVDLSAQVYALIGGKERYQFVDRDGDLVKLSLTGQGQARVILGQDDQPDIALIELTGTSSRDRLNVKVSGPNKETTLGVLEGDGDLNKLNGRNLTVENGRIDLSGEISKLRLGELADSTVTYHSMDGKGTMDIARILGDSQVDIAGKLKSVKISAFEDGVLKADSLTKAAFGSFDGQLNIESGNLDKMTVKTGDVSGQINVNGSLKYIKVGRGNLNADLNVAETVGRIVCSRGSINGEVVAGSEIGAVKARDYDPQLIQPYSQIDELLAELFLD